MWVVTITPRGMNAIAENLYFKTKHSAQDVYALAANTVDDEGLTVEDDYGNSVTVLSSVAVIRLTDFRASLEAQKAQQLIAQSLQPSMMAPNRLMS